jgi:hypothetical protein
MPKALICGKHLSAAWPSDHLPFHFLISPLAEVKQSKRQWRGESWREGSRNVVSQKATIFAELLVLVASGYSRVNTHAGALSLVSVQALPDSREAEG